MALFLQKDLDALSKQIEDTIQRLKDAIKDGAESTQQSSETWHDNFGFEESSRQQKMLGKQIEELSELRDSAEVVQATKNSDVVVVGSQIKLINLDIGERREFIVGSYMVLDKQDEREVAYTAPIIAPFFGGCVGDIHEISIRDTKFEFELVEIS